MFKNETYWSAGLKISITIYDERARLIVVVRGAESAKSASRLHFV